MKRKLEPIGKFVKLSEQESLNIKGGYDDDGDLTQYDSSYPTYASSAPSPQSDYTGSDYKPDYKNDK